MSRQPATTAPSTPIPPFRLALLIAFAWAAPAIAASPVGAFALSDLNPNSDRVGQEVTPRDYRQWVSAYYFGNEG